MCVLHRAVKQDLVFQVVESRQSPFVAGDDVIIDKQRPPRRGDYVVAKHVGGEFLLSRFPILSIVPEQHHPNGSFLEIEIFGVVTFLGKCLMD